MPKKLTPEEIAARIVAYDSFIEFAGIQEFLYRIEAEQAKAVAKEIEAAKERFIAKHGDGDLSYL